ncbi:hypothetical protein NEMBOFW57_004077 [Staphylotrichum longicolle]|uniref:Transaldolase n=1 Tax=Staphylotrichum longicolle TaxID=669026 RepID=A0AAD4I3V1_9PEZI|nr:hypothetical protein NEMBOFW57_004077 [Staphylotrichum longicolle]
MGFLHVQTNPKLAYSTQKTIKNAERIVSHFKQLAPDFDTSRVCIKIPSTWEGLQACRELNKKGLTTLATTVFSLEQAALAADVGCRYIAPYVNELRVHFDARHVPTHPSATTSTAHRTNSPARSYNDPAPALTLCSAIQHHLLDARPDNKTQVLGTSFTSVAQVMQLAGNPHITVPLLCLPSWRARSPRGGLALRRLGRLLWGAAQQVMRWCTEDWGWRAEG